MSLFDNLGGKNQQAVNPMQMLSQLKQNPADFISKAGFTVPQGMSNPQQIINHLMQSGQINQNRYAQAVRMLQGKR